MATFGLIGKPLSHSFSKAYFDQKFKQLNVQHEYLNFEIDMVEDLTSITDLHSDIKGLNVTIPYKRDVMGLCDRISVDASAIGAVNCLSFDDGKMIGHNTDYIGFSKSLTSWLEASLPQKALVLGSGGASKAIGYALTNLNIPYLTVSSSKNGDLSYHDLGAAIVNEHLLIVNTTPLGTAPHIDELPPFPYAHLTSNHCLYDLIYNPSETAFLKQGVKRGCIIKNGNEMLQIQAEESWKIWNP